MDTFIMLADASAKSTVDKFLWPAVWCIVGVVLWAVVRWVLIKCAVPELVQTIWTLVLIIAALLLFINVIKGM